MNTSANKPDRFRIGDLVLDAGTVSVRRDDEEIALPKLSFELLLCLARHAPNVVSTDTLMDEVWGQVVVGDETVKQRVKLLRKALGDSTADPRYIAAVRGRGYRLVAEVSPLADEAQIPPAKRRSRGIARVFLVAVALLAVAGISIRAVMEYGAPETVTTESDRPGSTGNPAALEAYNKGRAAYRRWTRQDNETALAFYQRAAELDPGFALAFAGMANANALRTTEFGLGEEWIDEAIGHARRALELEPDLPEALKALGICYFYKGHYQTALDYNRSALRLDPEYDEVIFNIAETLKMLGRWDEAVEYQRRDTHRARGLEQLSIYLRDLGFDEQAAALVEEFEQDLPVSFFSDANRSLHYLLDGEYAKARTVAGRMQRSFPNAALGPLRQGEINLLAGDLEAAARDFQAARMPGGGFQDYAALRAAHLQLLEDDRAGAESVLQQVENNALRALGDGHEGWFHPWHLAFIHTLRGNHDEALDRFEQAVDAGRRMYEWDELEPVFQPLHKEPRFQDALERQRDLREQMKRETAAASRR